MPHKFGEIKVNLKKEGVNVSGEIILPTGSGGKFYWKENTIQIKEGTNIVNI